MSRTIGFGTFCESKSIQVRPASPNAISRSPVACKRRIDAPLGPSPATRSLPSIAVAIDVTRVMELEIAPSATKLGSGAPLGSRRVTYPCLRTLPATSRLPSGRDSSSLQVTLAPSGPWGVTTPSVPKADLPLRPP